MNERGMTLWFVLTLSVVCSLYAYAVLLRATSQVRQATVISGRLKARSLAEAGDILARANLAADSLYCGGPTLLDTNGDGAGDRPVQIGVTDCCAVPNCGNRHRITTTVTF